MNRRTKSSAAISRLMLIGLVTLAVGNQSRADHHLADAVIVPAGSVNALEDAITEAGPGGHVVLASGVHQEAGTVMVTIPVLISGEEGAVIQSDVPADAPPPPFVIVPTLHIKNTHGVTVEGVSFEPLPGAGPAGTAVVIENSPHVTVRNNAITGYQFGLLIQGGDNAVINGNQVHLADGVGARGIQAINGHEVQITDNVVIGGFIGIFCTGPHGQCRENLVEGANMGIMLCTVKDNVFNISGKAPGAAVSANGWYVIDNETNGNQTGIIVLDGAFRNTLANNRGSGNAVYDLELAGVSDRFGSLLPTSSENIVSQDADHPLVVKDCGVDNICSGNLTMIDNEADPCF